MEKYQSLIFLIAWVAFFIVVFLYIRKQNKKAPFRNIVFKRSNLKKSSSCGDDDDSDLHLDEDGSDYH